MELRESGRNRELEREKRAREIQRTRILHDVSSLYVHCRFHSILLGVSFTVLLQKSIQKVRNMIDFLRLLSAFIHCHVEINLLKEKKER
jgi:hypothetical protein